ncbi:integrase, catalytic region, zinc finger, CCHC-type containing protein, partial [Tanacetum coccineum]
TGQYNNQRAVNLAGLGKMLEDGIQLSVVQADWSDDTDNEPEDQELEAHYMYMARIQEVTPDAAKNYRPIFDAEPYQKVHNNDDDYNVFANDRQHPEQHESVNDTYLVEQYDTNITSDSSDMSNNREEADQDDQVLQKERELLASLIEQMKIEIDGSKQTNKSLEISNKALKEANTFFNNELKRYKDTDFMTTLAEHIIVAGAENRPPMLEKSMYDSWAIRIHLFIQGKKHGRMMLDSIDNDDYDVQATNIILHGLPPGVYALVNHQEAAKDIWDIVKMLMKGTELSYLECECRLYNLFDKFTYVQGETLLVVPMFQQGENLIKCINKAMEFLSAVALRFPPSNNQLRTSSNPRNQATIQDGRVTVQQVQERQNQSYVGTRNRGIATTSKGNFAAGQPRVVKCYNCQGDGHMARQCTQLKRPRNGAWFKEKLMLVEAQEVDELDAYDSDCDDLSSAKVVLMANLSSCDPEVLSEVPYSESYPNDMINQDVQEMQYSEQTHVDDFKDNEIHSCSNIIPYSQYLQETQDADIQDTTPFAPNDLLVLSLVEQMTDHVAHLVRKIRQIKW